MKSHPSHYVSSYSESEFLTKNSVNLDSNIYYKKMG